MCNLLRHDLGACDQDPDISARPQRYSLALLVLGGLIDAKTVRAVLGMDEDRVLRVLFNMASADQLAEEAGGGLALARLVLEALDPGAQLGQLGDRAGVLHVLVRGGLLVGLDLGLGAAPLAPHLQHVGPDALRYYI